MILDYTDPRNFEPLRTFYFATPLRAGSYFEAEMLCMKWGYAYSKNFSEVYKKVVEGNWNG